MNQAKIMSIVERVGETEIKSKNYTLTIGNGFWTFIGSDELELGVSEEYVPDSAKETVKAYITDSKIWNNKVRYPDSLEEDLENIWYMISVLQEAELRDLEFLDESNEPYDPSEEFRKLRSPKEVWRERRNQIAKGNKKIYDYLID